MVPGGSCDFFASKKHFENEEEKKENEEKESESYMGRSVTFLTKGKLRLISGLTESRVQAWGGHQPPCRAIAGHVLGCSEQHGLGPCSRGWLPGGGARLVVMSRLC